MKRLICVGDSIRISYQDVVKRELEGFVEWLEYPQNPSKPDGTESGGETRVVLSHHLDEYVIPQKPDIVHFNAGLHDMIRDPGPGPTRRVPLEEYKENLRKIFSRITEEVKAKAIFALTTPVDLERQWAVDYSINRTNEDVFRYNDAAREVAGQMGVAINDLHRVIIDNGVDKMLGEDGVHFAPEGAEVLGKAVAEVIRREGALL